MQCVNINLLNVIMQVNPDVIGDLEEAGLKFVGRDESGKRMEVSFTVGCYLDEKKL